MVNEISEKMKKIEEAYRAGKITKERYEAELSKLEAQQPQTPEDFLTDTKKSRMKELIESEIGILNRLQLIEEDYRAGKISEDTYRYQKKTQEDRLADTRDEKKRFEKMLGKPLEAYAKAEVSEEHGETGVETKKTLRICELYKRREALFCSLERVTKYEESFRREKIKFLDDVIDKLKKEVGEIEAEAIYRNVKDEFEKAKASRAKEVAVPKIMSKKIAEEIEGLPDLQRIDEIYRGLNARKTTLEKELKKILPEYESGKKDIDAQFEGRNKKIDEEYERQKKSLDEKHEFDKTNIREMYEGYNKELDAKFGEQKSKTEAELSQIEKELADATEIDEIKEAIKYWDGRIDDVKKGFDKDKLKRVLRKINLGTMGWELIAKFAPIYRDTKEKSRAIENRLSNLRTQRRIYDKKKETEKISEDAIKRWNDDFDKETETIKEYGWSISNHIKTIPSLLEILYKDSLNIPMQDSVFGFEPLDNDILSLKKLEEEITRAPEYQAVFAGILARNFQFVKTSYEATETKIKLLSASLDCYRKAREIIEKTIATADDVSLGEKNNGNPERIQISPDVKNMLAHYDKECNIIQEKIGVADKAISKMKDTIHEYSQKIKADEVLAAANRSTAQRFGLTEYLS